MSGSPESPAVRKAKRKVEFHELDIDDVRKVDSDSGSEVVRVLYKAAPTEADSIGFQAVKPPGPMGDQQFEEQLEEGIRNLKDFIRGDSQDTDESDEETDTTSESENGGPDDDSDPPIADPENIETTARLETEDGTDSEPSQSASVDNVQSQVPERPEPRSSQAPISVELQATVDEDSISEMREELESLLEDVDDLEEVEQRLDEVESRMDKLETVLQRFEDGLSQLVGPAATPDPDAPSETPGDSGQSTE